MKPQSLYVHIPFCSLKCHYCDFAVRVLNPERHAEQVQRYLSHLELELRALSELAAPLQTLYIGGGTPALLAPVEIQYLLSILQQNFELGALQEWTLEANPEDLSEEQIGIWLAGGVNRVSLGVQSFQDAELQSCGRAHDAAQIPKACRLLREAGVENLSFDLIYGLPGQSLQSWADNLQAAIELAPQHLSLYALEVHSDTVFGHRDAPVPDDDAVADMYDLAVERLAQAGFEHYEIANWARPGCRSQHNQVYWRNQSFLAAGVGAHGYWHRRRYAHGKSLRDYYANCSAGRWPWQAAAPQTRAEIIEETVFLGLRQLRQGLDVQAFEREFDQPLSSFYPEVLPRLLAEGWLEQEGQTLRLSTQAVAVSSSVFVQFLEPQIDN